MSGRLPFDASKLRPESRPESQAEPRAEHGQPDRPMSVSALASLVSDAIERGVPKTVRVVGEVSGFRERTHWYFDLKDESAAVNAVVFASQARRLAFTPEPGQQVVATGRVDYYAKGGKVSLIVTGIEPVGRGAKELALRQLTEEARALGWLDPERKRAIPTVPRRIAVVTSRSSAALQDVIDTLRRRAPFVTLIEVDTRVQGDAAAPEIARAIDLVSDHARGLRIDAVVLTRGGGSADDLWCFNDRDVARAVVHCSVPVVAAIGHETDTTLAELVADERAATPTQAAMRVSPDADALHDQIGALARRLRSAQRAAAERRAVAIDRARASLASTVRGELAGALHAQQSLSLRLARARPDRASQRVARERAARLQAAAHALSASVRAAQHSAARRLGAGGRALMRAMDARLRETSEWADGLDRELHAVSPLEVLRRGYSVTLGPDGRALRSSADAAPGDRLVTRLAQGELGSVVEGREGSPAPRAPRSASPRTTRKPRRRGSRDRSQMDLFGPGGYGPGSPEPGREDAS